MAYQEPDLPVAGQPVSVSAFGSKVRNSIIWLKEQVDAYLGKSALYRQGGNATDWDTAGVTNYIPEKSIIQTGTKEFAFTGNSSLGLSITFPIEFSAKPQVYVSLVKPWNSEGQKITTVCVSTYDPVSTTGCRIFCEASSAATVTVNVNWMAIGPIA